MKELREKLHEYIDVKFHGESIFHIKSSLLSLYLSFYCDSNFEKCIVSGLITGKIKSMRIDAYVRIMAQNNNS